MSDFPAAIAGGDRSFLEQRSAREDVAALGISGLRLGTVAAFDADRGLGSVEAAGGAVLGFHSTAISDGSREIADGCKVSFVIGAALGGRYEAGSLTPLEVSQAGR